MHKKRIFKFFRNTLSIALAVSMLIGETGASLGTVYASQENTVTQEETVTQETVNASSEYGLADNIQDGVILHCFDWKYNDIKTELPNIAAAGFTSVQTSPAQRGDGQVWYWLYQPQTFSISDNALGTKADLTALCQEAKKYGIKVVVDVVANHTRAIGDDGLGPDCYHNDGDAWYTDRYGITHGKIGMPDLNSESSTVQNKVKGYIEELKSVGVEGIRWDAAKHISLPSENCQFWPVVTSVGLYNYGEILVGPTESGGESLMKEYTNYMSVTDSRYGATVRGALENGGIPSSIGNWCQRGVAKNKLVYWSESHDTYSNNGEYGEATQFIDQNKIDRAYAIVAAQGQATSLYFSRPFQTDKQSIKAGEKGSTHFTSKEVAAVNHMHNACVGEKDYYVTSNNVAAVCRETGATIVLGSGGNQDISIANGGGLVAPGTYTDEISGSTFTVTASTISGKVGDTGIAVIYNGGNNDKVSVNTSLKDGSSFKGETTDVTITVKNATSASYSIDGGAEASFTDSKTITIGADTEYGSTVKLVVKATGKDGDAVTKTFTYTKKEAGKIEKNTIYFTKPSGWSTPKIYAYTDGTPVTKLTGEWPGTALTDAGDGVYTYTFSDSVSAAKVIFTDGTNQDPTDTPGQSCGFDYASGKAYTYEGGTWTAVSVTTATNTPKPTNTTKPTNTPKPTNTTKPTDTPVPTEDGALISVDFANGSEFTTETKTVNITAANNAKGTYSVDNGPVKEFTGKAAVIIGKGKIANTDVTLNVNVGGESKVYTYKKVFNAEVSETKTNAANIEETVEEAKVNAVASDNYQTNPNGQVGSRKTITKASDFTEDMIIAQGVANDDPAIFRGSHEAPKFDLYAMYGAYDDTNLYIGIQYTNVIDVVDSAQQAPQTGRGKPYGADADIPQMLVFDTNTGDYTDGTANDTKQKTAWDVDVKYSGDAKVDKVFLYSPKDGINNFAMFYVKDGIVDYNQHEELRPGYQMPLDGVSLAWEDGFFSKNMWGINSNGYSGYVPDDLTKDSSQWVDFLTTSHGTEQDTFCVLTLPLKYLEVTASDIENQGIGVMSITTYGKSGMGSLPMDMTFLDNATEAYSQDDSTSAEKEDSDLVTTALARLGGKAGPKPTTGVTRVPTATPTVAATATPTVVVPQGLSVNFGADRSAPQYTTTELTVKAEATGATGNCNYEFFVDGTSVQNSAKDTYIWKNGTAGAHTIKVVVTDSMGNSKAIEKEYDLEAKENQGSTPTPLLENTATPKPTATNTPTPSVTQPASQLTITGFTVSSSSTDGKYKVGERFTLKAKTKGAEGNPFYMFTYIVNGEEVIIKTYGTESEASFIADQAGTYSFKVYVVDNNNYTNPEFETGGIVVEENSDGPDVTIAPDISDVPIITAAPSVTVTPTRKPTPTRKATPTPTRKPTPTKKATPTPTNGGTVTPKPGSIITSEKEKADFKVITARGSSKTVEYMNYQGTEQNVIIPSTVELNGTKYKITSISDSAFKNNKSLRTINIGKDVTKIGKSAFYGCTSLKTVTGASGIQVIGDKAFYRCSSLSNITLKTKLTTIGNYAFYKCTGLKKITIPSRVNKIGTRTFYGCKNLKTIIIKTRKLTNSKVGSSAFKGIYKKATVKVPKQKLSSYKKMLKSKGLSSQSKVKKM